MKSQESGMADDFSGLDQRLRRPTFTDEFWFSEAEALTRALQVSLSTHATSSSDCSVPPTPTLAPIPPIDSGPTRRVPRGPTGKITKRKLRQSKKSQTTFIAADPANFRQMVQEVTGVRFGVEMTSVTKNPDPPRGSRRVVVPSTCLPTLDTSALFLINRDPPVQDQQQDKEIDRFFDMGTFPTSSFFPDVDSWGAI